MTVKVQDVIDFLERPVKRIDNTVDGLIAGLPSMDVSGIAVTFVASQHAIEAAIAQGANLLISHEGEYYSHRGGQELWPDDSVVSQKRSLIEQSGIAIYRFHDYPHAYRPDSITEGLKEALGWGAYEREALSYATVIELPEAKSLRQIALDVKQKLDLPFVRAVGDPSNMCRMVGLSAGYRGGGANSIPLFSRYDLDLIVTGEGQEWETPEYVRDAVCQGAEKSLIHLGHAESEEPGMERLAGLLGETFEGVPVGFIKQKPLFTLL